jgi:hypothetical protein
MKNPAPTAATTAIAISANILAAGIHARLNLFRLLFKTVRKQKLFRNNQLKSLGFRLCPSKWHRHRQRPVRRNNLPQW